MFKWIVQLKNENVLFIFLPSGHLRFLHERKNLELINYQVSNIHLKYYSDIVTHFIKSRVAFYWGWRLCE